MYLTTPRQLPASQRISQTTNAFCYPFAVECALRERFPEIRMAALESQGTRTLVVEGQPVGLEEAKCAFGMEQVILMKRLPLDRRHQAKIDYPELKKRLGQKPRR